MCGCILVIEDNLSNVTESLLPQQAFVGFIAKRG
jgi:hypothetical protein